MVKIFRTPKEIRPKQVGHTTFATGRVQAHGFGVDYKTPFSGKRSHCSHEAHERAERYGKRNKY